MSFQTAHEMWTSTSAAERACRVRSVQLQFSSHEKASRNGWLQSASTAVAHQSRFTRVHARKELRSCSRCRKISRKQSDGTVLECELLGMVTATADEMPRVRGDRLSCPTLEWVPRD